MYFVVVDIIVPNIGATDGHKSRTIELCGWYKTSEKYDRDITQQCSDDMLYITTGSHQDLCVTKSV